ncbi:MAG: ATP-binding protein [Lachnospiraceae bacterium]|nr:ATP-binding protein [Lachnospiraceae bacterium]
MMEKLMAGRERPLHIRVWEFDSMCRLADHMMSILGRAELFDYYYSFTIPKLGKEFDLLRIGAESVINIELKSGTVSVEQIARQLELNRYYLAFLGRTVRSYTYLSEDDRLVRMTNKGRVIDAEWDELAQDIASQQDIYRGNIEDLFKEEEYIISPLTDPDRFLRGDYFLTSGQRDIERKILRNIKDSKRLFQGFTGSPGTGKTLLLYDIAMALSRRQRVCILHCGSFPVEMKELDDVLKRIDFRRSEDLPDLDMSVYSALLVDEGHRMGADILERVRSMGMEYDISVIFSYDSEECIAPEEMAADIVSDIERLDGYELYRLTNRIRTNRELSSFAHLVLHNEHNRFRSYSTAVSVAYAEDEGEMELILDGYRAMGYTFIYDESDRTSGNLLRGVNDVSISEVTCKELDKVVMLIDGGFYYDERGYLRSINSGDGRVRRLFSGLSRARNALAVIVVDNPPVLDSVLRLASAFRERE